MRGTGISSAPFFRPARLTRVTARERLIRMQALRRVFALSALSLALIACERAKKAPPVDSAAAPSRPSAVPTDSAVAPPPPASTWDAAAGPVLLVRADSPGRASVVFPQYVEGYLPDSISFDVAPIRDATVELYGHAGALGATEVRSVGPRTWHAGNCIEWPSATVAVPADSAVAHPSGWSVALFPRGIAGVTLDSIEGLPPADSAKLAADITRLASALPGDTARAFRGIPFAVRNAYRFTVDSATPAIAADVVRKVPQEAMPLEEHTFIIAERRNPAERFTVVHTERTSGTDESLVTTELLAALRLPSPSRTALVLLREGFDTSAYAVLERSPRGTWRVRWTSVRTGC